MKAKRSRRRVEVFEVEVGRDTLLVVSAAPESRLIGLSPVEQAVACDAAAGLSNAQIARRRRRSARTIANQLASIYRKLGVASRAELAARLSGGA